MFFSTFLKEYRFFLFLLIGASGFLGCHKAEPVNIVEEGNLIDKIVCVGPESEFNFLDIITTYDLYKKEDMFNLLNINELTKGVVPFISKDRTWIAYISLAENLSPKRINVDGTQNIKIPFPDTLAVQDISISPDGNKIAVCFHPQDGWESGIYLGVMNSDGTDLQTIYADSGRCFSPDWSPDGSYIYFMYVDVVNKYGQNDPDIFFLPSYICKIKNDGTDLSVLKDDANNFFLGSDPSVSPDGKKVVFDSNKNYPAHTFTELFIMDSDGKNITQLTEAIVDNREEDIYYNVYTRDSRPRWINDGEHIIFHRETDTWDNDLQYYLHAYDLNIINMHGSNMQPLTRDGLHSMYERKQGMINLSH